MAHTLFVEKGVCVHGLHSHLPRASARSHSKPGQKYLHTGGSDKGRRFKGLTTNEKLSWVFVAIKGKDGERPFVVVQQRVTVYEHGRWWRAMRVMLCNVRQERDRLLRNA
jgi:hypothetical protein